MAIKSFLDCLSYKKAYMHHMELYQQRAEATNSGIEEQMQEHYNSVGKSTGCGAVGLTGLGAIVMGTAVRTGLISPEEGASIAGYLTTISLGTAAFVNERVNGEKQVSIALTRTADVEGMNAGKKSLGIAKWAFSLVAAGMAAGIYKIWNLTPEEANVTDHIIYLAPVLYAMWNITIAQCDAGRDFLSEMIKRQEKS